MRQVAIKTPTEGPSPFTGYTIYRVQTDLINNNDEVVTKFEEHYEVCDDANGLPIASDLNDAAAVSKAKTILGIRSNDPGAEQSSGRKNLNAAKRRIKINDASVPVGCSVFQVKTVELDELGNDTGRSFDEHHEVCNDITGLPIAADAGWDQALLKAIAVLEAEALNKEMSSDLTVTRRPPV